MAEHAEKILKILQKNKFMYNILKLLIVTIKIKIRKYKFIAEYRHSLKQWEKAEKLFYKKEYLKAIDCYTAAIDTLAGLGEWYKGRGNCKRQLGRFDKNTRHDFVLGIENAHYRKSECVNAFFNYLWEAEGLDHSTLNKYENVILKENNNKKSAELLANYAAMFNHVGDTDKAIRYYKKAASFKKESVNNLLALAGTVAQTDWNGSQNHNKDFEFYSYLKNHENALEDLLNKYDNSIAVVGNSPKELGKEQGTKIDKHGLVVRFNDYSVSPPYDKDYGTKTNIWVRSVGDWVPLRDISEYEMIMVSGMHLIHRYREWDTFRSYAKQSKPIVLFPSEIQYELIEKLRAVPTAGITFCYMLYKIIGPLNPDSMFGFSFTDHIGENAVPSHYYDSRPPSDRHNWHAERALFHQLLR